MKEYNLDAHQVWVDHKNKGVSHFGVVPEDYDITSLCIDIFHERGNVHKVFIMYIQKILAGNWASITAFANILKKWDQWDDYVVITWILGKSISNLRGSHTLEFSDRTDQVCKLLSSMN